MNKADPTVFVSADDVREAAASSSAVDSPRASTGGSPERLSSAGAGNEGSATDAAATFEDGAANADDQAGGNVSNCGLIGSL